MNKRENVIKGLECCIPMTLRSGLGDCENCPYDRKITIDGGITECCHDLMTDALALLKAHEVATVEPKRIELADETKAWLNKMDAVDALNNIADICIDWDGYRTADGLGGLINEIWAYARYCADRLLKAQEPIRPGIGVLHNEDGSKSYFLHCSYDGTPLDKGDRYCRACGRAVKWDG